MCHTGVGNICHIGVCTMCHTGVRTMFHTGVRTMCHIGVSTMCHTGVRTMCHTGVRTMCHTGIAMYLYCYSADSDSMSFSSSFVSLSRPSFPVNIKSPSTKSQTGSDRSPKSPLQLYTPHPAFNSLAGKILGSNTRSLRSNVSPEPQPADPKPSQDEVSSLSNTLCSLSNIYSVV